MESVNRFQLLSMGGAMFREVKLQEKYHSYVEMCGEEEIDPAKVMDFDQYCQMYREIVQSESHE